MIGCGFYAYLFNEVGSIFKEFKKTKKLEK